MVLEARNLRKRAVAAKNSSNSVDYTNNNNNKVDVIVNNKSDNIAPIKPNILQQGILVVGTARLPPPPFYGISASYLSGNSPPPTYEDSLLDQLYFECLPQVERRDSKCSSARRKSVASTSSKSCRR